LMEPKKLSTEGLRGNLSGLKAACLTRRKTAMPLILTAPERTALLACEVPQKCAHFMD
jgi:hypothetical protein